MSVRMCVYMYFLRKFLQLSTVSQTHSSSHKHTSGRNPCLPLPSFLQGKLFYMG